MTGSFGEGLPCTFFCSMCGGGSLNQFGEDFKRAGLKWTPELCRKDSDRDGRCAPLPVAINRGISELWDVLFRNIPTYVDISLIMKYVPIQTIFHKSRVFWPIGLVCFRVTKSHAKKFSFQ